MECPKRISDTKQVWRGDAYWRCGNYFSRPKRGGGREYLHRRIYADWHGPIPEGWHVHHRDHDRSNNDPANLALLRGADHLSLHGQRPTERQMAARRANRLHATAGNAKLTREQRSASGHAGWHKQRVVGPQHRGSCRVCGKETVGWRRGGKTICSGACAQRDLRRRRRERRCVQSDGHGLP